MSCGGSMKKMKTGGVNKKLFKGKETYKEELAEGKAIKSGKISPKQYASGEASEKKIKKMALGGTTTKRIIKKSTGGMYGIPQENLGTSGQYGFAKKGGSTGTHKMPNGKVMLNSKMKKGGATKATKFAALAPPYDKATFADKIVGAKKNAKMQKGGSVKKTTLSPNSFRYNNGIGVATNEKGKINFISQQQMSQQPNNVHTNSKDFYVIRKPTYKVSSDDFNVKNNKIYNKKTNFEKSIDTTGYSKGKKSFDVISKFSLPGGDMKKITTVKTNRKGALDTIKRMKNEAKKPFKTKK
jgi:hypothetical protein